MQASRFWYVLFLMMFPAVLFGGVVSRDGCCSPNIDLPGNCSLGSSTRGGSFPHGSCGSTEAHNFPIRQPSSAVQRGAPPFSYGHFFWHFRLPTSAVIHSLHCNSHCLHAPETEGFVTLMIQEGVS